MSNNTRAVEVFIENGQLKFQHYHDNPTLEDREAFSESAALYFVATAEGLKFNTKDPVAWMSDARVEWLVVNDGCLRVNNDDMNKPQIAFKLNMYNNGNPIQSEDPIIVNKPSGG